MTRASASPATLSHVPRIELIPTPTGDGTIVLRAITIGPGERLRRAVRRLLGRD